MQINRMGCVYCRYGDDVYHQRSDRSRAPPVFFAQVVGVERFPASTVTGASRTPSKSIVSFATMVEIWNRARSRISSSYASTHPTPHRSFFRRRKRRRRNNDTRLLLELLPIVTLHPAKHDRVIHRSTTIVVDRLEFHQVRFDLPREMIEVVPLVHRAAEHLVEAPRAHPPKVDAAVENGSLGGHGDHVVQLAAAWGRGALFGLGLPALVADAAVELVLAGLGAVDLEREDGPVAK